jgi:hypothetical protein
MSQLLALSLSILFMLSVPSQMFAQHSSRSANTKKTTRVDNDSARYKARRANAFKRTPQQVNLHGETVGTPVEGAKGVQESTAQIMARQQELGNTLPVERAMPEREGPDRSHLPQALGAPAVASWPINPEAKGSPVINGSQGIVPAAPQTTGTSFTGATLADTGAFPPDTMGAVGPTQFVVFVNGRVRTFNKTTGTADGVINVDSDVFFASVLTPAPPPPGLNFTSDPNVRFDRLSQRWFLTIIDVPSTSSASIGDIPNRILIAVSDAASAGVLTPATVWTYYFVQQDTVGGPSTGEFLDYPSLGIDNNALYIGGNMFGAVSGTFVASSAFVIRKSSVLSGGPVVTTAFRGILPNGGSDGPYAPRGVDNYDPAATEGYFIGISNTNLGQVNMRRVGTPGGTPTISADIPITVPATNSPRNVTHLGNTGGGSGNLDPLDDRLFAAHIRNGRLWTAHNITVDTTGVASAGAQRRDATRWYELIVPVGAGTPTLNQSGTIFDSAATFATARNYWIPSAMVSGQGHAAFGYSTAGTAFRIDAATSGRLSGDTLGTSGAVNIYTASSTAYNPPSDPGPPRRWGDYSFTSLDPKDDMTMWTIQEFCDATNTYGVRAVKLIAPPPATPAQVNTAGTATATTVPSTRSGYFVDIAGTQVSGSGFYDPGADIAGATPFTHVSATVTAGVGVVGVPPTVNSATYINPTTVRLSLNTTASTPNLPAQKYTVNITNPDGQTASAAILQVVLPPTAATSIISGQVTTPDGAPLSGTVISLSGTQSARAITDSSGNYRFDNVESNGFYTVKPSRANYTFGPGERSFSALADKTDAVFTANPLPAQVANPLDTDLYFVRQQYLDFLGRDPDPDGLAYWTSELDRCGTDATCLNDRRIGISAAFFMEEENQNTGSFIYRLYQGALDRQVSYNEFSADRLHVVGGPALAQSKVNFAEQFVQRAEFTQKYQDKNTAESFVDALLSNVKQASGADLSGQRGALIASYNAGANQSQSRSLALREIIEQPDFKQAVYNSSFVLMEYFGYLKRDPDPDGFKFWFNVLNNREPGNYRGMVCSFITSAEYQSRFSSFISHSNRECGK